MKSYEHFGKLRFSVLVLPTNTTTTPLVLSQGIVDCQWSVRVSEIDSVIIFDKSTDIRESAAAGLAASLAAGGKIVIKFSRYTESGVSEMRSKLEIFCIYIF